MTTVEYPNDPSVTVTAGGRHHWLHNPEVCEIDYVLVESGELKLKASAGGTDRGIAMAWSLPADFLLRKYAECLGIDSSGYEFYDALILHLLKQQRAKMVEVFSRAPILTLGLNVRTTNLLIANSIETLEQLTKKGKADLLRIPGFGRKRVTEVEQKLAELGYRLGEGE